MSPVTRIAALLALQKGRVDRAIGLVHQQNRLLREREFELEAARQGWSEAVSASVSCDAYRTRMHAVAERLRVAEEALVSASAAATEARTAYRRTLARQEALITLQASWQQAQRVRRARLEEQES